jgi:hypothetical protein
MSPGTKAARRIGHFQSPLLLAAVPLIVALLAVAPLAVATGAAESGDSVADRLLACRDVPDSSERLECFDKLAEDVSERPSSRNVTTEDEAVAEALPPLADDVGKSRSEDEPPEEYSGRVTSCEKSEASGRWYFTFDNGQVWRQSNKGRLPFRECDFAVTLKRDVFGYKLELPSENRTVRVSRIQ